MRACRARLSVSCCWNLVLCFIRRDLISEDVRACSSTSPGALGKSAVPNQPTDLPSSQSINQTLFGLPWGSLLSTRQPIDIPLTFIQCRSMCPVDTSVHCTAVLWTCACKKGHAVLNIAQKPGTMLHWDTCQPLLQVNTSCCCNSPSLPPSITWTTWTAVTGTHPPCCLGQLLLNLSCDQL